MTPRLKGYHFSPGYTQLTIWTFDGDTRQRISTGTRKPNAGMTRRQRYLCLTSLLSEEGIPVPDYREKGSP